MALDDLHSSSLPMAADEGAPCVAASRLVLFVGAPPAADAMAQWSRRGIRCLHLASVDAAIDAARRVRFDAVVLSAAPVDAAELLSHLLGRVDCAPVSGCTPAAGWRVDRVRNRLHGATRTPVSLTEAQAALLQALIDADGRVVPRAQLAAALVPSHGHGLQPRSIDVYLHRLRTRLREAGATARDIEAVRGRGYRLGGTGGAA